MSPLVSIIMTAYNTEAYVGKAIESALGQTYKNIEMIVVENGSCDGTREIIHSFNDPRLKVLLNDKNEGMDPALNRALRHATGKWVTVLDSDDWFAPERIERLMQVAEAENPEMIADDVYLIRDGENSPWSTLIRQSGETIDTIRDIEPAYFVETDRYGERCLHFGLSRPIFKREFLVEHGIQYDEKVKVMSDYCMDLECLLRGARFIVVPEPYYYYRARAGSVVVSEDQVDFLKSCYQATARFLEYEAVKNNPRLKRALLKALAAYDKHIKYLSVVGAIKRREGLVVVKRMLENPYFFFRFIMQLPNILGRRIEYYILGNKTVYDMIPEETNLWSALAAKFQFGNRRTA
jgi:succinoglycan biosynthesis protein ExoO